MTFNINVTVTGLEGLTSILTKLVSVVPLHSAPGASVTGLQEPIQSQVSQMQLAPAVPLAPAVVSQQQPIATVPVATQLYSMEQLAVAATQLMDAGRRTELISLLSAFGVQTLTSLPKEQYGAFATQLRAMGAQI